LSRLRDGLQLSLSLSDEWKGVNFTVNIFSKE